MGAYQRLLEAIRAIRDMHNPELDVDAAATMTWSAVHGFASLQSSLSGVARKSEATLRTVDETLNSFTSMMMNGYRAR